MGRPISHSLSPVLHNAAFSATDFDWAYVAFDVGEAQASQAMAFVRALRLAGVSVTMPLKSIAFAQADRSTAVAKRLGSANTLFWDGFDLVADSTDGAGFAASLDEAGVSISGRDVVIIGAGSAARAVGLACLGRGAQHLGILARRSDQALSAVSMLAERTSVVDESAISTADLIVNATPQGMAGVANGEPLPGYFARLHADQVVVDLVYNPLSTSLLRAAKQRGALTVGGTGMLLHQAALQFERWTHLDAPVEAMRTAMLLELETRSSSS